jgi:hypothetical protein
MKRLAALLFFVALPLFPQSNSGELRLRVTDPDGRGAKATVRIISTANQYRNTLATSDLGNLDVQRLPFGIYQLEIEQPGLAAQSESVEIRSSLPIEHKIQLRLPAVNQSVIVSAANTLVDPDQAGSVSQVGSDFIQDRLSSVPGRDLQDLVNSQPGWLYEGNAVLHPRGSEYQTQFVVDGIPLTDNRSPSFGPGIEADDVESMSIFTAGIPAEYGRKMGGVVEVNTRSGGSFRRQLRFRWSIREGAIRLGQEYFGRECRRKHDGTLFESCRSAKLFEYGYRRRFFFELRTRFDAGQSSQIYRTPRACALRHPE